MPVPPGKLLEGPLPQELRAQGLPAQLHRDVRHRGPLLQAGHRGQRRPAAHVRRFHPLARSHADVRAELQMMPCFLKIVIHLNRPAYLNYFCDGD